MARKIVSLLVIFLLVVIVFFLIQQAQQTAGAEVQTPAALPPPPDFVGWVMGVDPGSGQIKVESQSDKIVRPVTAKLAKTTMIFRREKGVLRLVDISEVHPQDQAELWLIGLVPSTFPAEVNVRQVIVENPY